MLLSLAAALILFVSSLKGMFSLMYHSLTPLPLIERQYLQEHSHYFRSLEDARKQEFAKHLKAILYEKEWIGKGIKITREMRVRIAAALVQLTIGLDRLLLLHFKRIVVFPNEYMDRMTGNWHQGDVRPGAGTIALSWKHFEKGFEDPFDGRNLGLHELAHALWFENRISNQEHNFLHPELLEAWRVNAMREITRMRNGEARLFRAYASTNHAEFFAVAVEYFFERPKEFKEQLPELYATLSAMLNQDPAAHPN